MLVDRRSVMQATSSAIAVGALPPVSMAASLPQPSDAIKAAPAAKSSRGVVAATFPEEVAAGLRMLEAGGNAFDALVAAGFASYVLEPSMCGVGGYARLSAFVAQTRDTFSIDGYVRAPQAAHADMFEIDLARGMNGFGTPYTKGFKMERGPLSVAVPGAVASLFWTQRNLGRLPWAMVLEPAIELAKAGVEVTQPLLLDIAANLDAIRERPDLASLLLPNGRLPSIATIDAPADRLFMGGLADTLELIATEGANGFYTGQIAEAIETTCQSAGGIISREDLKSYRPTIRRELPQRFANVDFITGGDPSGYEMLGILGQCNLQAHGQNSVEYQHLMAEALACGFVDNIAYYGDPDVIGTGPAAALSDPALAARRAAMLNLGQALPRPVREIDPGRGDTKWLGKRLTEEPWPPKLKGTTRMTAADREGNMVSMSTSISGPFGSFVAVPGTGIILNNSMWNFDPRPNRPNSIAPRKMPMFAAPILLAMKKGQAVFACAGAGGFRVTTGVLHTFVNWAQYGMSLADAVAAPRVHCQGGETYVDNRIDPDVQSALAALGHTVIVQPQNPMLAAFGRVSAVSFDPRSGELNAASDPSWWGAAGGL